jgi:hypothetical protein
MILLEFAWSARLHSDSNSFQKSAGMNAEGQYLKWMNFVSSFDKEIRCYWFLYDMGYEV